MQELLRAYGLNHDEALSHLRAVLERYGQAYEQARIRCVSTEANGIWHNALCVIKIHPSGIQGDKEASRRYGKAHLLEQWVKPEDLLAIFDQIQKGVIKVDGEDVSLGAHTRFDEWEFLPSNNDYSSYPGYVFRTPHVVQVPGFPHHEPLLSYDLPFYSIRIRTLLSKNGVKSRNFMSTMMHALELSRSSCLSVGHSSRTWN